MTQLLQVCDQCFSIPCGVLNCVPCPPPFLSTKDFYDISREQNLTDNEIRNINQLCGLDTLRSTTHSVDINTSQPSLSTLTSPRYVSTSLPSPYLSSSTSASPSSASSTESTKSVFFTTTSLDDSTKHVTLSSSEIIGIVVTVLVLTLVCTVLLVYIILKYRQKRNTIIVDDGHDSVTYLKESYNPHPGSRSGSRNTRNRSLGRQPGGYSNAKNNINKTDVMDSARTSIKGIKLKFDNKAFIDENTNAESLKKDRDKTIDNGNHVCEITHM